HVPLTIAGIVGRRKELQPVPPTRQRRRLEADALGGGASEEPVGSLLLAPLESVPRLISTGEHQRLARVRRHWRLIHGHIVPGEGGYSEWDVAVFLGRVGVALVLEGFQ